MEVVNTLDIGGTQWELQDVVARQSIAEVESKVSEIMNVTLGGTFSFSAKMKYLGEDETYKYYDFWWESQSRTYTGTLSTIIVLPSNTSTDKILALNLNVLQNGNTGIDQRTQHFTGPNESGMVTYIFGTSADPNWIISGMGILRRKK